MKTPEEIRREALLYINDTPALLSLLYDTNLLPEQTHGTSDYYRTLLIAHAWKAQFGK